MTRNRIKKIIIFVVSLIISVVILINVYPYFTYGINSEILNNVKGQIHYTKRVNGDKTIFTSNANLQDESLVYKHNGEVNNNILDFFYDKIDESYYFVAMDNGEWSKLNFKNGTVSKLSIGNNLDTNYISNSKGNISIYQKKGSIYMNDMLIKKFYGVYDDKFTGYRLLGLSPDGKYFLYHSNGYITGYGYIFWSLISNDTITDLISNTYIMDLETLKSTYYVEGDNIQWEPHK